MILMKYKLVEFVTVGDKEYIEDYRIKNAKVEFIEGKKSDLREVYATSPGIGDLLSCFGMNDLTGIDDLTIVQYGDKYALGVK